MERDFQQPALHDVVATSRTPLNPQSPGVRLSSAVPSELFPHLAAYLKAWANFGCPSGTCQ